MWSCDHWYFQVYLLAFPLRLHLLVSRKRTSNSLKTFHQHVEQKARYPTGGQYIPIKVRPGKWFAQPGRGRPANKPSSPSPCKTAEIVVIFQTVVYKMGRTASITQNIQCCPRKKPAECRAVLWHWLSGLGASRSPVCPVAGTSTFKPPCALTSIFFSPW